MKTKLFIVACALLCANFSTFGQTLGNDGRNSGQAYQVTIGNTTVVPVQPIKLFASDKDDPTRDSMVADDMIVTGSLGVGYDCVDGEAFGFTTILLKENNTRLKFDDTSLSAGFPANDWNLVANDASSGGENYFAIEDVTAAVIPFKVMAGAPLNSFRLSSTGAVGFGTANPLLSLHVKKSDSPGLRLEQDSLAGWTAQTWDLAGNESNFFIRDVTNGSTLPFRIQPGTPSNTITLKSTGNVGIGTWDPAEKLEVNGSMKLAAILTAPATPTEGVLYMDGNDHLLKYHDGTQWNTVTPNTDEQDLVAATLTGTTLQIDIENGASVSVDLQPILADLEARVAALEAAIGVKENTTAKTALSQNVPNPFTTSTTIPYFIPNDIQNAVMAIYNVKGEKIKEIQITNRGEGALEISKNDLPAGSYFYTLILDGNKMDSKIMIKAE